MFKFSSREKIAALLSGIVSIFLISIFSSVILFNHYKWTTTVREDIKHEVAELLTEDLSIEEDDNETEDSTDQENYYLEDSFSNGTGFGIFKDKNLLNQAFYNQSEFFYLKYNGLPYKTEQTFLIYRKALLKGKIYYAENITDYISYEDTLIYSAGTSIVISLILSWFVGLWAGKRILRPLRRLMEKVKSADLKKIPKNIVISGRADDEIVELSKILQSSFEKIEISHKSMEDFNHNVSHELKNPLAIIRSDIELAILKNDPKKLSKTLDELKYLDGMMNKLLFIAQDESKIILKDINIAQIKSIIEDTATTLSKYYKGNKNTFKLDIRGIKQLKIDQHLFKELIFNLLENAYKYSQPKGEITISLGAKKLLISNITNKKFGEDLNRIFEPFFKLDSSRSEKGYGIGLSVVKKICEIFKWEILVKNNNKEITFELRF